MQITPIDKLKRDSAESIGIHPFKVDNAFDTRSKKGNEMLEVHLTREGRDYPIKEFFVFTSNYGHMRLEKFLKSIGLSYPEDGVINPSNYIGRYGKADFQYKIITKEDPIIEKKYIEKKYLCIEKYIVDEDFLKTANSDHIVENALNDSEIPF